MQKPRAFHLVTLVSFLVSSCHMLSGQSELLSSEGMSPEGYGTQPTQLFSMQGTTTTQNRISLIL